MTLRRLKLELHFHEKRDIVKILENYFIFVENKVTKKNEFPISNVTNKTEMRLLN